MKIVKEYPPNYKELREKFGFDLSRVLFPYGDILFNPSGIDVPLDVMVHEGVHQRQQGSDIEDWWKKYIEDDEFRLSQELEAYRVQYQYLRGEVKDRNRLHWYLIELSKLLSGPTYNYMISLQDAMREIKHGE